MIADLGDPAPLLDIDGLTVAYRRRSGLGRRAATRVLDHFDLQVQSEETLGLVGESGCGKTTLLLSLLRLRGIESGTITFNGQRWDSKLRRERRANQRDMQIVFQNPFSSLDPRMRVRAIIAEPLRIHNVARAAAGERVAELLQSVKLGEEYADAYPHELSGGQAQRVALARALALRPKLLVLDEPTSALDVSVQAQVLNLLLELQAQERLTYIFVSHDLGVVEHISDRIAVMYLGEIVEIGPTESVINTPSHPYTQALMQAQVRSDGTSGVVRGEVPSFDDLPSGCRFHSRCPFVMEVCRHTPPPPLPAGPRHVAACHLLES